MKTAILICTLLYIISASMAGQTWQAQKANVPGEAIVCPLSPVDENVCWAVWTTSWTSAEFYNGFLVTTDGGNSWKSEHVTTLDNLSVMWIEGIDANTAYMAAESYGPGSDMGIYKTTDQGATWQKHPTAFLNSKSNDWNGCGYIHFFDTNNGVAFGEVTNRGDSKAETFMVYTTTDAGVNWNVVGKSNLPKPVDGEYLQPVEVAEYGDCVWLTTISNKGPRIIKTTDKGNSWKAFQPDGVEPGYIMFAAFQNESDGLLTAWSVGKKVSVIKKTTDGGDSWVDLPGPYGGCIPVNVSYVPGTGSTYVITGDEQVNSICSGSAYTLDGGNTWNALDDGDYCYLIFDSPTSGWATGWNTNTFYKYVGPPTVLPVELTSFTAEVVDKGINLSWSTATETNNRGFEIQRKIEEGNFATIGFIDGSGTSTEKHKYSFTDKNIDKGKYHYRLKQMDYNGQFEYSKVIEVEYRSPDKFSLEQNYPNPFNPSTTIGYVLEKKCETKISLINAAGEQIAVLVNEIQDRGYHKVHFNAKDLPSGIYFYQLMAGENKSVKKMILMK